jgi:hypothetical protein
VEQDCDDHVDRPLPRRRRALEQIPFDDDHAILPGTTRCDQVALGAED